MHQISLDGMFRNWVVGAIGHIFRFQLENTSSKPIVGAIETFSFSLDLYKLRFLDH